MNSLKPENPDQPRKTVYLLRKRGNKLPKRQALLSSLYSNSQDKWTNQQSYAVVEHVSIDTKDLQKDPHSTANMY
jgi:hypothetical protein